MKHAQFNWTYSIIVQSKEEQKTFNLLLFTILTLGTNMQLINYEITQNNQHTVKKIKSSPC